MKIICQIVLLSFVVCNLFTMLHLDINGREAKKPGNFYDVIASLIVTALFFFVCFKAGAFSMLFK